MLAACRSERRTCTLSLMALISSSVALPSAFSLSIYSWCAFGCSLIFCGGKQSAASRGIVHQSG